MSFCHLAGIDNLDGGNRTMFGSTGTAGIFSTYPQQYFGLWVGLAEQVSIFNVV